MAMKGRPRPNEYKMRRAAPQATVFVAAAAERITARTGPMHGVLPAANATPTPKAPGHPWDGRHVEATFSLKGGDAQQPCHGQAEDNDPHSQTRTIVGSVRRTKEPKKADATPRVVNTSVNPATKANDARNVVSRASLVPRDDVGRAEIYET